MASKRPLPYDEPPSPDSSSSEEDEDSEELQQQTPSKPEPEPDSDNDDSKSDEDDESDDDSKSPIQPNTHDPVPEPGSDSETDDESLKPSDYTIKPVVKELPSSKPKEKSLKVSKSEKSSNTRPQKAAAEEDDGVEKKFSILRVWTYEDEIAVLQAMIDFKKDIGKDPGSNQDEFYNFVKLKLVNGKLTKSQVIDKVRRLKKKYKNYLNKSCGGKDVEISNPHEYKSFQLSKRIWGDIDTNNASGSANVNASLNFDVQPKPTVVSLPAKGNEMSFNSGGGSHSNGNVRGKSAKKMKTLEKVVGRVEEDMMEVDDEEKGNMGEETEFGQLYPHLMMAFEGKSLPSVPLLDGLKRCLNMVDSSELEEWDRKWKKVRIAETEAYISRLDLIQEQTGWFCNAMKSSKH